MNINTNTNRSANINSTDRTTQQQDQAGLIQQVASFNLEGMEASKSLADTASQLDSKIQEFINGASPEDKDQVQKAFDSKQWDPVRTWAVNDIKNKELQKQVAEFIVQNNIIKIESTYNRFNNICGDVVDEKLYDFVMNPAKCQFDRVELAYKIKNTDKRNQAWASIGQDPKVDLNLRGKALGLICESPGYIGKYQDLYDDTALSIVKHFNYDVIIYISSAAIKERLKYANWIKDQRKKDEAYYSIFIDKNHPITDLDERLSILQYISNQSQHLFKENALEFVGNLLNLAGTELYYIEKIWLEFSPIVSMNFNYDMLLAIINIPGIDVEFCMYLMRDFMDNHIPNAIPEDDLENSTAPAA